MGLFNFFNRKNAHTNGVDVLNPSTAAQTNPEIPEDLFIEKEKPNNPSSEEKSGLQGTDNGINVLFQFLEKNFESKGYEDALINPDNTHLEHNTEALKNDLERVISKVKTFYEDFIRDINFHIGSRSRSGMVDTVEELTVKKETAENHIKKVMEIEKEAKNNNGIGHGIVISYTRGFRNGLAAISHHSILRKNF